MFCQQLNWLFKAFFSQIFLLNANHTITIYGEFFYEETNFDTKTTKKYFWNSIKLILQKFMKIVWLAFFQRLSVWNCMISMFGLWRSTRVCILSIVSGFRNKDPFVLLLFFNFPWSFRQNFNMFKDLFLESRNIQTQNCAPI